jgi:hypothetical protein
MKSSKTHTTVATATALAAHLFCSREAITRFEKQHILERLPDGGYDLDDCRRRVLEHLRQRKPVGEDRRRFERARAEREELRIRRECHDLVKRSDFEEGIDAVAYVVLKHLAPLPSRLGGRDLAERKRVEAEVRIAQQGMSDEIKAMGEKMAETGKAV